MNYHKGNYAVYKNILINNACESKVPDYPFQGSFVCAGYGACSCTITQMSNKIRFYYMESGLGDIAMLLDIRGSTWLPATDLRIGQHPNVVYKEDKMFANALNVNKVNCTHLDNTEAQSYRNMIEEEHATMKKDGVWISEML